MNVAEDQVVTPAAPTDPAKAILVPNALSRANGKKVAAVKPIVRIVYPSSRANDLVMSVVGKRTA